MCTMPQAVPGGQAPGPSKMFECDCMSIEKLLSFFLVDVCHLRNFFQGSIQSNPLSIASANLSCVK